ncbi:MAG: haloacid dehalogenase-like hydrolase [Syntrophobacteraceae bacterium]
MVKATVLLLAAAVVSAVCHTVFAGELNRGLFSERNYNLLDKLISESGNHSPNYDAAHRPYVVCDWDNTSAFGDAEETLTYYMLQNLSYALSVSEFRRAACLNVPRGESKLLDDAGKPVVFDDLVSDLVTNYTYIYNNYSGFAGNKSLEKVKASEEYKDFAAKVFVMFDALDATHGTAIADQWQGQLMSGMTSEQLVELSEKSIRKNLGGELRKIKLSSSNRLKRRCNGVSSTTFQGLRIFPDMANLYRTLMDNGIDVYVVSASPEDIIVALACNSEYGYRIPRENVYGVKFAKNNGVLQPELSSGRPMTWGPGKVELIRKQFAASKGYSPVLICGDSDGDHNMLSEFPETKLALIVNRLKKGNIGGLCELACKQLRDSNPRYILQGIDENTGLFSPGEATIKFGTTEKRIMK